MARHQKPVLIQKKRVLVTLQMSDGNVYKGHLFVDMETRVLDLMNGPATFIPFHSEEGAVHLLNKFEILQVVPRDQKS